MAMHTSVTVKLSYVLGSEAWEEHSSGFFSPSQRLCA